MKSICVVYMPERNGLVGKFFKINESGVTPSFVCTKSLLDSFNKTADIVVVTDLSNYPSMLSDYKNHYGFIKRHAQHDFEFWYEYKKFFDKTFLLFNNMVTQK